MSTMGGGASSPEFEKLIALAQFVQGPDYLDRVKHLQELESAAREATDKAAEATTAALAAQKDLDVRKAKIEAREKYLLDAQAAHDARVSKLQAALNEARRK